MASAFTVALVWTAGGARGKSLGYGKSGQSMTPAVKFELIHFCRSRGLTANPRHDAEDAFHGFLEFGFAFSQRTFYPIKNRFLLGRRVKLP